MKMFRNVLLMVFAIMIVLVNTFNSYATEIPLSGSYKVQLTFTGGTGKVTANTPTELSVSNGTMTAKIILSSSNYTYMIVNGEYYYNTAEIGKNSTFIIPISELDKELDIIACTEGMSSPHEIDYKIKLSSEGVNFQKQTEISTGVEVNKNAGTKTEVENTKVTTNTEEQTEIKVDSVGSDETIEASSDNQEVEASETVDIVQNAEEVVKVNTESESIGTEETKIQNKSDSGKFIIVPLVAVAIIVVLVILKKRK